MSNRNLCSVPKSRKNCQVRRCGGESSEARGFEPNAISSARTITDCSAKGELELSHADDNCSLREKIGRASQSKTLLSRIVA